MKEILEALEDVLRSYNDPRSLEERCVDRYEDDNLLVSTVTTRDRGQLFETAIKHPQYNNGALVIVQEYNTKEEAQVGHDEWVEKMTQNELPKELMDMSTCKIAELCFGVGAKSRIVKRGGKDE